jgi:antirestriction protein ArdC
MPPLNADIDREIFRQHQGVLQHGGSSAFYSPSRDIVQMPERKSASLLMRRSRHHAGEPATTTPPISPQSPERRQAGDLHRRQPRAADYLHGLLSREAQS